MDDPFPPADDAALVRAAQSGQREAFGRLVERHKNNVLIFLAVRMRNASEAEDLAQEAFVTAWKRLGDFDSQSPFSPWLRGIAHNLLRNHWRKHRPEAIGGSEELAALLYTCQEDSAGQRENGEEIFAALRHCLSRLEPASQELVRHRYQEGASIEALAAATARKTSAVTMHLHRIRGGLKLCIERQLGGFLQ